MLCISIMDWAALLGWCSANSIIMCASFWPLNMISGGQLYVPVHQADRLTRYIGAEGAVPGAGPFGRAGWHEKKGRVKQAVIEVRRRCWTCMRGATL